MQIGQFELDDVEQLIDEIKDRGVEEDEATAKNVPIGFINQWRHTTDDSYLHRIRIVQKLTLATEEDKGNHWHQWYARNV